MGCAAGKEQNNVEVLEFLSFVKLFKRLPPETFPQLASCSKIVNFKPGSVIIRQGDEGNELYVIMNGEAEVMIDGKKVATVKRREYFGENALLRDEPRGATIRAVKDVKAIKISRTDFRKMRLHEQLKFAKRGAVGGGNANVEKKEPTPKTDQERADMLDAIKKNENIRTMVSLEDEMANQLINAAWKETVPKGTQVMKQGDVNADYFYIVLSGSFEFTVQGEGGSAPVVGKFQAGSSFGEMALLYRAPRAATVVAIEDSAVWLIDRNSFKECLSAFFAQVTQEYAKYLDDVKVLSHLKPEEKQIVAGALVEMNFSKDERIFEEGEKGTEFYMLVEGEVTVSKDKKTLATLFAASNKVQFFGDTALLTDEPRNATIIVQSPSARTLVLDRASFNMLVGDSKDGAGPSTKEFGKIKKKDLKTLGLLGCGGFGTVQLVEHVPTGATYALKGLSKGYVVQAGMQSSVMSEKNVQLMCNSDFIVQLYECYNGDQSLYLLLECCLGGEIYATYNKKNFWGACDHARFYIAGTVFAFEHLHGLKIIFRDLKPENLLINDRGEVKLTDMGLAKVVPGTTYTTCGTPDYFAPEIIASKGHTKAVDWWTLGILLFELLSGHPPFESQSPMQTYAKVNKGIDKASFPKACKGVVEDLIKGLCKSAPGERLPIKKGGTKNIKDDEWYKGFNWGDMFSRTMTPPYKPVVKDAKDIANFSASEDDMPPQVKYKDNKSGWDKDFATSD